MASLKSLLNSGRLERVVPDAARAESKLKEAKTHLESARKLIDDDPHGAYQLLYDAARKAVDAQMLTEGYRTTNQSGAHAATAEYAAAKWAKAGVDQSARRFNKIRLNRNRAQYGEVHLTKAVIENDLRHAKNLVKAVEQAIQRPDS